MTSKCPLLLSTALCSSKLLLAAATSARGVAGLASQRLCPSARMGAKAAAGNTWAFWGKQEMTAGWEGARALCRELERNGNG